MGKNKKMLISSPMELFSLIVVLLGIFYILGTLKDNYIVAIKIGIGFITIFVGILIFGLFGKGD